MTIPRKLSGADIERAFSSAEDEDPTGLSEFVAAVRETFAGEVPGSNEQMVRAASAVQPAHSVPNSSGLGTPSLASWLSTPSGSGWAGWVIRSGAVAMVLVVVMAATAYAGALPGQIQGAVHDLAAVVGIELPDAKQPPAAGSQHGSADPEQPQGSEAAALPVTDDLVEDANELAAETEEWASCIVDSIETQAETDACGEPPDSSALVDSAGEAREEALAVAAEWRAWANCVRELVLGADTNALAEIDVSVCGEPPGDIDLPKIPIDEIPEPHEDLRQFLADFRIWANCVHDLIRATDPDKLSEVDLSACGDPPIPPKADFPDDFEFPKLPDDFEFPDFPDDFEFPDFPDDFEFPDLPDHLDLPDDLDQLLDDLDLPELP